jgi:hypothetical protein
VLLLNDFAPSPPLSLAVLRFVCVLVCSRSRPSGGEQSSHRLNGFAAPEAWWPGAGGGPGRFDCPSPVAAGDPSRRIARLGAIFTRVGARLVGRGDGATGRGGGGRSRGCVHPASVHTRERDGVGAVGALPAPVGPLGAGFSWFHYVFLRKKVFFTLLLALVLSFSFFLRKKNEVTLYKLLAQKLRWVFFICSE